MKNTKTDKQFECTKLKAELSRILPNLAKLHRLTTHSLRHYAITSFSKQTNGNIVLTSRFARHSDANTTMVYVSTKKEELYQEIDNTFSIENITLLKKRITNL